MLVEINREYASDLISAGNPRYMVMLAGPDVFYVADLIECVGVRCHKPKCDADWRDMQSIAALLGMPEADMPMPEHTEVYGEYSDAKRIAGLLNGGLVTTVPGTIPGGMIG